MPKELSAKDKAYIQEKEKLVRVHRKEIAELGAEILKLDKQNKELTAKVQELEKIIAEYEAHFGMSMEEFAAHCEREKKATEAVKTLMSLPNALGIGGMY